MSCQDLGLALGQLGKEGCRGLPTSTWRMFPILSWRAWLFPKYLSVSLMKDPRVAGLCNLQMPQEGMGSPPKNGVLHGLDSPETSLKCTRRIHGPWTCVMGFARQETDSEMEWGLFNVWDIS